MMIAIWTFVFLVSLMALIKGAGWLLESAEKIGLAIGLSPFIIGVIIIGLGTSFPELVSSIVAMFRGVTEFPAANAVGSNIANIFLVLGISVVVARKIVITKNIIDLDLSLLSITTVLTLGVLWDKTVTLFEVLLLLAAYVIYLLYTVRHQDGEELFEDFTAETLSGQTEGRRLIVSKKAARAAVGSKDILLLALGIVALAVGANYIIESVVELSALLGIGTGLIAITAVALGTSLPELFVSVKAALHKKAEVAIGNIFGSNIFNGLMVIGIPGLLGTLTVDELTFTIGIPAMAAATLLFVIAALSKRIYLWEGALFLMLYVFVISKLLETL